MDQDLNDFSEILRNLLIKYHQPSTTREMKIQLLTLLPVKWSISHIIATFHVTFHTAIVAKNLAKERGVLLKPRNKIGTFLIQKILLN